MVGLGDLEGLFKPKWFNENEAMKKGMFMKIALVSSSCPCLAYDLCLYFKKWMQQNNKTKICEESAVRNLHCPAVNLLDKTDNEKWPH